MNVTIKVAIDYAN